MKKEIWEKVKEVLQETLSLEKPERKSFLDKSEICVEVRKEIESLLEYEEEAQSLMHLSAIEFSKYFFYAEDEDAKNAVVGQRIGIYEIVKELGFGGMGAVYLATRTDGKFEQKAALKLLRREYNTERIRLNFRREKEILATLSHPNIARLLDAGTTDDGVPYLVMEYIEGEPIDAFCRNRKYSLYSRLKLFNKVCDAVGFAHRSLVVHRDIKPSNIIVTAEGIPKLLDFGISKLLDSKLNAADAITMLGAMTPEYASPEQIRGESVTTATDIYSLGVVLFKILTEKFPYNFEQQSNEQLFKEITDTAPTAPSQAISTADDEFQCVAPTQLKGDLDNIVLKALSKEPKRRYQTVEQFSADIWRFIDGLPVSARPATFGYRAGKFLRRHKISVIAAGLIFLSLIMGIAVAVWQADVARRQAQIATDAQRRAELETAKVKIEEDKTRKVAAFIEKIFSYANPGFYDAGAKTAGEAKVIDVIDELSEKIENEFPDQPDIQAELHHKFAETYVMLSHPDLKHRRAESSKSKALRHAEKALELRKRVYGEKHELIAVDLFYVAKALDHNEKNSLEPLNQAIAMMRETDSQHADFPHMLAVKAETLRKLKLQAEASDRTSQISWREIENLFLEALPLFQRHYPEMSYLNTLIYADLWITAVRAGDAAKAAEYRRQTEAGIEKLSNAEEINFIRERVKNISALETQLRNKNKPRPLELNYR